MYYSPREIYYYSERFEKSMTVPEGFPSDGATGAFDVCPEAWYVHDWLCDYGLFDDGSLCTNYQASMIIGDILAKHGRWFRRITWPIATFIGGGGQARKNGMFTLKTE